MTSRRTGSVLAARWLVAHVSRQLPTAAWLCCLPHSGGSASAFTRWADRLPPAAGLMAVEYPGRGSRFSQPAFTEFDSFVDALAGAVIPSFDRSTPLVLFGHSLGARAAFELARRLAQQGRTPAALLVSGASAPHVPSPWSPIAHLSDREFLAELRARFGLPVPDEVAASDAYAEILDLLLPVVRADLAVYESYRFVPGPRLECPIVALLATDDRSLQPAGMEAWRELTSGAFTLERTEGDHWSVLEPDGDLLRRVSQRMHGPWHGPQDRSDR